jgi:AmmeMemoRadiSam system protein A
MTTVDERRALLKIARDAIVAHVTRTSADDVAADALASQRGGAFVTIHHRGDLRGCIGHIEADRALAHVVAQCAVAACSADPRFPPVAPEELPDIDVELSVLGPLESIHGPDGIDIGRHGLLVARDGKRGLLLPQVATEWKWDALAFLAQTCRKAGLPADAWKNGASVWRFEAEVFGEATDRASVR